MIAGDKNVMLIENALQERYAIITVALTGANRTICVDKV